MHVLGLLAVVVVPTGVLVGAVVMQHLEGRLLGSPADDGSTHDDPAGSRDERVARAPEGMVGRS